MWNEVAQKLIGVTPVVLDQMLEAAKLNNTIGLCFGFALLFGSICLIVFGLVAYNRGDDTGMPIGFVGLVLTAISLLTLYTSGYNLWLINNCPEYAKAIYLLQHLKDVL